MQNKKLQYSLPILIFLIFGFVSVWAIYNSTVSTDGMQASNVSCSNDDCETNNDKSAYIKSDI